MEKHSESRLSYLFAHLHLLSSDLFSSDSSHLCFSTVHIVGSFTSKLPSNIKGVFLDGVHVTIYSSTMDPSWDMIRSFVVCNGLLLLFDSELLCHRKFTFLQFLLVSALQEVFFFMNYPREESDPLFQAAWSENVERTLENPSIPAKKTWISMLCDFGFGMKSHHHRSRHWLDFFLSWRIHRPNHWGIGFLNVSNLFLFIFG